ncbi:hypothetical protein B0H19DRAFT_1252101 [Mycena capillaripes]|nr:hypothetical protein B0H19DRAFT_1252101 [Mycena capillaripes]
MDSDSSVSPLLSLACRFLPHDQWFTTHIDPDWKVKQVKSWLLAKVSCRVRDFLASFIKQHPMRPLTVPRLSRPLGVVKPVPALDIPDKKRGGLRQILFLFSSSPTMSTAVNDAVFPSKYQNLKRFCCRTHPKCLPYAAPPSPPLRQSTRKPQRPPSPITFAPDPRHRPISPITFAVPKKKQSGDDASEYEQPVDDDLSDPEPAPTPEEILPPVLPKKRAILPTVSTSTKGDLYSQFTLIRFSTGQLLEDDLPLSFYDMQADELLELHRAGVVVPLPRANPARYLDAYWEGSVRVLRMRPIEDEEDSYALYKIRHMETRALEWQNRWLVVREGSIYLCRDENRLIHTLSLADLIALTNSGLPPSATSSSKARIILARFSALPNSHVPTRASSPLNSFDSDSSSALSSPVFAHDSSDSGRARRKIQKKRLRKRSDPEFLILDLKEDAAYVSLLRVLHRHSLPRSTFVDKLPVGPDDFFPEPRSAHPDNEDAEDEAPPPLRHPPSLAHLRGPSRGLSLGALPYPEWRTALLQRARRAGMGRIGKAVEWVLWNGDTAEEPLWLHESPVRKRGRGQPRRVRQPTSTDGYDSDVSGGWTLSDGEDEEGDSDEDSDEERAVGARSETEWVGWLGDLRRQARVAREARESAEAREEARRIAEETRDAELGMPPLPSLSGSAEVTIVRVGTGVDDRVRRAAMEPSAVVTSLSGSNPPTHSQAHYPHSHASSYSTYTNTTPSTSGSIVSPHATPVLSSPSSTESMEFAFSPLVPAELEDDAPLNLGMKSLAAHTRAHSHTLLHSVSMLEVQPHTTFPTSHGGMGPVAFDAFPRRPSMPVIGSAARWGEGSSRPSSVEGEARAQGSSSGITEVPRAVSSASASASLGRAGSISKGLLRKKDHEREKAKESESEWRKGKEKEKVGTGQRPRLSVSTSTDSRPPRAALSPPGTPMTEHVTSMGYYPDPPNPTLPVKKKKRGLARGVSIRAEKFVKSLDSALDFVDGR